MDARQEQLVLDNLKLVPWTIQQYFRGVPKWKLPADELVQIGKLELVRAAIAWDRSRDVKFNTVAVTYIRRGLYNRIARYIGVVTTPSHRASMRREETIAKYRAARRPMRSYIEADMTCVAEPLEEELDEGAPSLDALPRDGFLSIDAEHEEEIDRREEAEVVTKRIFSVLNERQQWVLLRRAEGWSLKDCADVLNVSRERVRAIQARALVLVQKELGLPDKINIVSTGHSQTRDNGAEVEAAAKKGLYKSEHDKTISIRGGRTSAARRRSQRTRKEFCG